MNEAKPVGNREMGALWVAGVVAACLLVGRLLAGSLLDLDGKAFDWAVYAAVGVGGPALAVGLPLAWGWLGWPVPWGPRLRRGLAAGGAAAMTAFIAVSFGRHGWRAALLALALALAQTVVVEGWRQGGAADPRRAAAPLLVALCGWSVALSVGLPGYLAGAELAAALALAFGLLLWAARPGDRTAWARPPGRAANVAALLVLGFLSLRTEDLFVTIGESGAQHHWGVWVGTIDLMRQGGWLLWDTPGHYGFLDMVLLGVIPAPSWTAMFFASAASFFVVGAGVYAIGRAATPGWPGWALGLALGSAISMFSTTTFANVLPNFGAYRYLPGFVLLMLLAAEAVVGEESKAHRQLMAAGCVVWAIGALWSPESLVVCTAAWQPAYVVMSLRQGARAGTRTWPTTAAWLALPVALMAGMLLAIERIWIARLGERPDWPRYLDYVAGPAAQEVLVTKQVLLGSGALLLLGYGVLLTGAASSGVVAGKARRPLAFWVGLMGLFLGAGVYTQQRAWGALAPLACAALLAAVAAAARGWSAGARDWPPIVRAGALPLLTLALAMPLASLLAHPDAPGKSAAALAEMARHGFTIEWMLPDADPELQQLLRDSGVTAETPLAYAGSPMGNVMMPWTPEGAAERTIVNPQWTPAHPGTMLKWLSEEPYRLYVERFLARESGGWLILAESSEAGDEGKFFSSFSLNDFVDVALGSHVPTKVRQDGKWLLMWWEADSSATPRPEFPGGILRPLPPDVVIDGVPLAEEPAPEVWATFGVGWRLPPKSGETGRNGEDGARLWVYSPDARSVRVEVPVLHAPNRTVLEINGVGGAAAGGTASTVVALQPGWNAVEFGLAALPEKPADPRPNKGAGGKREDNRPPKGWDESARAAATPEAVAAAAAAAPEAATPAAAYADGRSAAGSGPLRFAIAEIRIETGEAKIRGTMARFAMAP